MALNAKIKKEIPNSVLDLLRETRQTAPQNQQSGGGTIPSPQTRTWNNFGTGEDPLIRKVAQYNQQEQTGRSPLASPAQQAQRAQAMGINVTPAQAKRNLRDTFGTGRQPARWENLTNEQRAAYNTIDPEHRLYNVRSSTNFSPANQTLQLLTDSQGRPTIRRGVLSGGREAQRQMDARDQRLLEKLRSGAYETATPEQQKEMAGANQRAFARTPEYRSAMMQLAAAGGANMTPEQQREFISQRLQPKAERWAQGLVGQRPMSEEEYEQAQSSLSNRTKETLEHTGGLEGEAKRTIQDYMKELEDYDPLQQAKEAATSMWYKATAAGYDVGGLTPDEINAMETPWQIMDAVTHRIKAPWTGTALDGKNGDKRSEISGYNGFGAGFSSVQNKDTLWNAVDPVLAKELERLGVDPYAVTTPEAAWVDRDDPNYTGGANKEYHALVDAVKGQQSGVQDFTNRVSNRIRQRYNSGEVQNIIREIENLVNNGQGFTASQYYGSAMKGLTEEKSILEAALRENPNDGNIQDALKKLNQEIKTWEYAGVFNNKDFKENSGYKTKYNIDKEIFELNKIINSDYTETWWNTNKLNDHRWDLYMSPIQRATWNYLYNSAEYGPKDAKEYFDGIKNNILSTRAGEWQRDIEEKASQNVGTEIAAGLFNITSLPFRSTSGVVGQMLGQNPNDDAFAISNAAQIAEQTVKNDIREATKDNPVMQGIATTAFDVLIQAGNSYVGTAFGGLFSNIAGLAAGSAGSHAMSLIFQPADAMQLSYQKYTKEGQYGNDAQLLATVVGGLEFGTEMLGMEWALKGIHSSKHPLMCAMVRSSIAEALEEAPGNATMLLLENTLLGNESEINRDIAQRVYEMRGQINEKTGKPYTDEEARALATSQVYGEWALNTLYEMGVAGLSAGPHAALQTSIDRAGFNHMVNDHVKKGDITAEQAETMKEAHRNAVAAVNGNDESMLDQDLQARAQEAQTEMFRNAYNREAANNPQAQQIASNIADVSARTFARLGMMEDTTEAETEDPALRQQQAEREAHAPAEAAETVDNTIKNNAQAKAEAAQAAQNEEAAKHFNNAMRLKNQIDETRAEIRELEDQLDDAMHKYQHEDGMGRENRVVLGYNGLNASTLQSKIAELNRSAETLEAQMQEENRKGEEAQARQPVQMQEPVQTQRVEDIRENGEAPAEQGGVRGFGQGGLMSRFKDRAEAMEYFDQRIQQADETVNTARNNLKERMKDAREYKRRHKGSEADPGADVYDTAVQLAQQELDRATQNAQDLRQMRTQAINAPEESFNQNAGERTEAPTIQAETAPTTQAEAAPATTQAEATPTTEGPAEKAPETQPTTRRRKKPNITQAEYQKLLEADAGIRILTPEEYNDLNERAKELDYYFAKTPFNAAVQVEGKDVLLDGFESSGKDATVRIKTKNEDGSYSQQTVPLKDVDFGDNLGIEDAYKWAAAYTDTGTARNFLAGFEQSAADIYNYTDGFAGIYAQALSGMPMTEKQQTSAAMIEAPIREMIEKAAQRARGQMEEELGITGETAADIAEMENQIAEAGSEQAKAKDYTGVVRDFKTKMNARQRANMNSLHWISKNAGMKITLTDNIRNYVNKKNSIDENAGLNGFFRTGTNEAIIDVHSLDDAAVLTAFHEAWHFCKQEAAHSADLATKVKAIETILENHLKSLPGYDMEQRIKDVIDLYKQAGQNLSRDGALEEIYADALRGIADRGLVTQFQQATGAETVLEKIRNVLNKWKNYLHRAVRSLGESSPEVRAILNAKEEDLAKLSRALRITQHEAGQTYAERMKGAEAVEDGGERFSIQTLPDGRNYVEVETDQDIFDGVDKKDLPRLIEKYMTNKFRGRIIGTGDNRVWVDRRGTKEYARPARKGMDQDIYEAKARAGTELDNLMETAVFDKHIEHDPTDTDHPENTDGWDYFNVLFGIQGVDYLYSGRIIAEYVEKGRRFHDMTHVKETGIPRPGRNARQVQLSPSDKNIQQTEQKVKDADYMKAVNSGDMDTAARMVEDAAKKSGYTLKATHRTNADFNVFDKTKRSGKNGKTLGDGFYVAEITPRMEETGRRSEYDSDAYGKNRIVAFVNPGNTFRLADGLSEEQAEYVYDKYFKPFHEDRFGTYKPHVIEKLQSSTRLMDYIIEAAETNKTTTDEVFKDLGYNSIKDGLQYAIFDSEQIKRADPITRDDSGNVIPLSERFNAEEADIRYSVSPAKNNDSRYNELLDQYRAAQSDVTSLREKVKGIEATEEFDQWMDRIANATKNGGDVDAELEAYKKWTDGNGYEKASTDLKEAEKRLKEANKAFEDYIEQRDTEKEKKDIEASGLTAEEWYRKQAVKEFGYTTSMKEAGYLLPNGKMLNFSGEKGRHYGYRAQDHRAIGSIFASSEYTQSKAMVHFMEMGNIRMMPESPGLDISTAAEPTTEQYNMIRKMATQFADEEYFNVDLTDANGNTIGSLEYEGRINPARIVNDIKKYFQTGEIADTANSLDRFRYSLTPSPAAVNASNRLRLSFASDIEDGTANTEMQRLLEENRTLRQRSDMANEQMETLLDENRRLRSGEETAKALNENAQMRELVQAITTQLNEWRGENVVDEKQIARMARMLRRELETTMPFDDLKHDLTKAFEAMARAKTPNESKAALQALSDLVLYAVHESSHADKTKFNEYKEARQIIKSIKFSRADYNMINDAVGDKDSFRRKYFGRIAGSTTKLAESSFRNAYSVEDAWRDLHDRYGNMFPDDIQNPADQLAHMLAFLDETEIQTYNPYTEENPENLGESRADYVASDWTMRLLREFMTGAGVGRSGARMANVERLLNSAQQAMTESRKTEGTDGWAKRYNEQIKALRAELEQSRFAEKEADRRRRSAERRANQEQEKAETAERKYERERMWKENARLEGKQALQRQREDFDTRRTLAEDKAMRNQLVAEINRKRKSLLTKLEKGNTSRGWVPTAMQDAVTKLLQALDFDGEVTGTRQISKEILEAAKAAYESINKGTGPEDARGPMASYYNGDLVETFDELISTENLSDILNSTRDLTAQEVMEQNKILGNIRDIVAGFSAAIINANEMFTAARSQTLSENGETQIQQSQERISKYGAHRQQGVLAQHMADAMRRGLLKPTTVFGEYEGTVMGDIWKALRGAENTHIRNITQAETRFREMIDKYHMQKTLNEEQTMGQRVRRDRARKNGKLFHLSDGQDVRLTTQELMTLYAWQKREKLMNTNHLLGGGFTIRNQQKGGSISEYRPNEADLRRFNEALTDEQKQFVDEMVSFLSNETSEWGNEVSEQLYGISKFTEKYYLPFTVNKNYVGQDPGQTQDARLKVASFTKNLTKNASTTLELAPFMQLWAGHVEQMSDFNAFTLPIEDMTRLMNYRQSIVDEEGNFVGYGKSMRPLLQQAWGKQSVDYIHSFLSRLNGNSRMEHGSGWLNTLMGSAKGAAVTFNLSVAMQQMGAGVRAMAEMNPIDVTKGIGKGLAVWNINKQYAELEKYAPIATEKAWGYFDTNMKNGLYDRQRTNAWSRVEDLGGKMAEFGDKFNWVQIWQACKSEARRQNKGADSETILKKAGERFTQVIDRTQVVDSVFQRAEWATEKGMMKYILPFMSEPITMYNMLYRSASEVGRAFKSKEGRTKAIGKLVKSCTAITLSGALTALLKSLVTGLRDRDNDKKEKVWDEENQKWVTKTVGRRTYWDKVRESWGGNMLDNILGVGTVFSSAIEDALGSYRSSGSLTDAWIGNIVGAGKEILKGEDADWEKAWYKMAQGISSLSGVGFSSFYRDSKAIYMTIMEETGNMLIAADAYDESKSLDERLDIATKSFAYNKDFKGDGMKVNSSYYTDLMLETYMQSGMGDDFQKVADAAISVGATEKGLLSSFKTKLGIAEPKIEEAAQAVMDGDTETYNRIVHELVDAGIGTKAINSLIKSAYNKLQPEEEKDPGTGEGLIGQIQEELEGASLLTTQARALLTEDATADDIQRALNLFKEDEEDNIANEFSLKYKKPYVQARQGNDKEAVKKLEQILLTKGTGIDRVTLDKWVKDDYSGKGLDILKNTKTPADAAEAVKVYQQGGIDQEGIKSRFSGQFKKQYVEACMNGNQVEAKRLQGILLTKGTGIDQKTLDGWVKDGYNDEAAKLLTSKATDTDVSRAIGIYQKGGFTQKEISSKISDKYKKAYVQACVNGNTSEASRLQRLCLTKGSGITSADIKEWTGKDLFGTQKDTGLYWQIMNGNTDAAKKTSQWLYRNYAGGQKAVKEKVLNWAKTRKKNGTETDWATVKTVLLALGYSASTIRSAIGI